MEYKDLVIFAQLGIALKGHSSSKDPHGVGQGCHSLTSHLCLILPLFSLQSFVPYLPQVLILKALLTKYPVCWTQSRGIQPTIGQVHRGFIYRLSHPGAPNQLVFKNKFLEAKWPNQVTEIFLELFKHTRNQKGFKKYCLGNLFFLLFQIHLTWQKIFFNE